MAVKLSGGTHMHDTCMVLDFSGDTDSKHAQYLKDRNALLNQQKVLSWGVVTA